MPTTTPRKNQHGIRCIQHIPHLPESELAQKLLERLRTEFQAIAQARKYNISSLTEMCCCDDGIHHIIPKRRYRGRFRKLSPNVAGYNRSTGRIGGACEIHIRLRLPSPHHGLLEYEEIAGVMIHEMSHCEVGSHSAEFYELMEEIEEQYHQYQLRGIVLDKSGFPVGMDDAYRLGGGKIDNSNSSANGVARAISAEERRTNAVAAAERRSRLNSIMAANGKGRVLGTTAANKKKLPPRDAARIAAERRLKDAKWCLPCEDIIDLIDPFSDQEQQEVNSSSVPPQKKDEELSLVVIEHARNKPMKGPLSNDEPMPSSSQCIDLTSDHDDQTESGDMDDVHRSKGNHADITAAVSTYTDSSMHTSSRRNAPLTTSQLPFINRNWWNCRMCTYVNKSELALACDACGNPRVSPDDASASLDEAIANIARDEAFKEQQQRQVKDEERRRSELQFDGFDIYGSKRKASRTMKHLT